MIHTIIAIGTAFIIGYLARAIQQHYKDMAIWINEQETKQRFYCPNMQFTDQLKRK